MSAESGRAKRKVRRRGPGGGAPGRREAEAARSGSGARYTPRSPGRPLPRFRPRWHKGVGALLIPAGFGLFVVCRFNVANIHAYGGHIWYLLGFAMAASSVWWWGAFDPPGSGFRA